MTTKTLLITAPQSRLDKALAQMLPEYSRGCLQNWVRAGHILVNNQPGNNKQKLQPGDSITLRLPEPSEQTTALAAEPIALNIRYADEAILVVNKPAGLVVHPAPGHAGGTLQNALLYHYPELATIPRTGIVHRLDKDTSGLLVIARSLRAHKSLVEQLQQHQMQREYQAIAQGNFVAGGTIDAPLGRHPIDRKRIGIRSDGKPAITHYRIAERFRQHTLLNVRLETGRTHQIRVHLASIKKPLLGDPVYGGRLHFPPNSTDELKQQLQHFRRQALHAAKLGLTHPLSGESQNWQEPMPDDMLRLLQALREDTHAYTE